MPSSKKLLSPRGSTSEYENLRLITKVSRLYHEQGLSQPEICKRLHISQSRVSRLLKKAEEIGIIQTTVLNVGGVYAQLEDQLETKFDLSEVVVVDTGDLESEEEILPALGSAAAQYLESTLTGGDRIGISSWSSTLLATVDAMRPRLNKVAEEVVQVIGGVGETTAQSHAVRLSGRLGEITGARVSYLAAPGLVDTEETKNALISNANISAVLKSTESLSLLLVGIGSIEPSALLKASGNSLSTKDMKHLLELGAVGDVCLRYFDELGNYIENNLSKRIVGISVDSLRSTPRRIAVAGGSRKHKAIRAALIGKWVNILITDHRTALDLIEE